MCILNAQEQMGNSPCGANRQSYLKRTTSFGLVAINSTAGLPVHFITCASVSLGKSLVRHLGVDRIKVHA